MTSLDRRRANFVLGLSICMIAFMGIDQAAAQSRPQYVDYYCASCHGRDGIGRYSDVPNIAGQDYEYMRNQFDNFLTGRRRHHDMTYYADRIRGRVLEDILDYYSRLPSR
jgi:cytochrome c553